MSYDTRMDLSAASQAARHSVLAIPRLAWGTLVVTGPERASWLNGLVTCEVAQLEPGQAVWGLVLTRTGKITTDLKVLAQSDRLLLAMAPATAAPVAADLDRMLIMEDAELADRSGSLGWFTLHGPKAGELAAVLERELGASVGEVVWTGLGDHLVVVPSESVEKLTEVLSDRAVLGQPEDWLVLRLERQVPEYGVDFDQNDKPHEAGLERRTVSWSKGCYLGQEVVCMQDMRGRVKRRLESLLRGFSFSNN